MFCLEEGMVLSLSTHKLYRRRPAFSVTATNPLQFAPLKQQHRLNRGVREESAFRRVVHHHFQQRQTKQKQKQKESVKVYEAEPDTEAKEAPLWMVFLIGDKDYKQAHVTTRLTQVLEDVNDKSAIEMFEAAQRAGEAMCGKYDQEVAEFYAEQLTRSDPIIYAEAREDKDEKD